MNRRHEWENLLSMANEDLKQYGFEIRLTDDGEGAYDCDIYKDGSLVENYAGCYYEDELDELVNEAWHYVLTVKYKI